MPKSHATGWENDPTWKKEQPTPAQMKEFFDQVHNRRITRFRLQAFLNESLPGPEKKVSDTKIGPGVRLFWMTGSACLCLEAPASQTSHGGRMLWENGDDKFLTGYIQDEDMFFSVAKLIAQTHGLRVAKLEPCGRNWYCEFGT